LVSWIEHFSSNNISWLIKNLDIKLIERISLKQLPGVVLYKWYGKQKRHNGSILCKIFSAMTLVRHFNILLSSILDNAQQGKKPPKELSKIEKKIWNIIGLSTIFSKKKRA
jgi:hypothetical protein